MIQIAEILTHDNGKGLVIVELPWKLEADCEGTNDNRVILTVLDFVDEDRSFQRNTTQKDASTLFNDITAGWISELGRDVMDDGIGEYGYSIDNEAISDSIRQPVHVVDGHLELIFISV